MVEWQYKVEIFNSTEGASKFFTSLESWLNKLGEDGWNLVHVEDMVYIFKRSKR